MMVVSRRTNVSQSLPNTDGIARHQKRKLKANVDRNPRKKPTKKPSKQNKKLPITHLSNEKNTIVSPIVAKNPQATLLGLPTELRLEIYHYVFDSSLIHVHRYHANDEDDDENKTNLGSSFIWTPCRAPNPNCSLLCLNPKWSGLCKESERCTYRPYGPTDQQPAGFNALSHTCRRIHTESHEILMKNTTVSIQAHDVHDWIRFMKNKAPLQLALIRRVTINAPDNYWSILGAFDKIRNEVSNLEGIGFQGQVPIFMMRTRVQMYTSDPQFWWRRWTPAELARKFDQSITVALEGYVWAKPHMYRPLGPVQEEHTVFRIVRAGKESAETTDDLEQFVDWKDDDVVINTHTSIAAEPKRTAQWRKWWRLKAVKGYTS
ncbi:hypothetical protein B0J11DRAFT_536070 [Dendryphion nanum]|uniref:DUF7730 domain-containing protein n=1 Tax=Dendryphion nanum TaxID=256645 RepID=A0A9P9IFT2_9PLEO|nr:hypothetical protein B0J11DRAFT_536070 [Dendryphion nanum]